MAHLQGNSRRRGSQASIPDEIAKMSGKDSEQLSHVEQEQKNEEEHKIQTAKDAIMQRSRRTASSASNLGRATSGVGRATSGIRGLQRSGSKQLIQHDGTGSEDTKSGVFSVIRMPSIESLWSGDDGGLIDDDAGLPDKRDPSYYNECIKRLYVNHPKLVQLDLSDAIVDDNMVPRLSDAISKNYVLKSISLATNGLSSSSAPDLVAAMAKNTSVATLDLAENSLGSAGAEHLAKIMPRKHQLVGLDLSSNLIRDKGCRALVSGIMECRPCNIQWLNLSENSISDLSAADLSGLIEVAEQMVYLDLSRNAFHGSGLRVIADELAVNKSLQHINLSHVPMGTDCIEQLSRALAQNKTLVSLDMYGCYIGDKGATYLGAALAANHRLEQLDIGTNEIAQDGFILLADGIQVNKGVKSLKMWGNTLGKASNRLMNALLTNDTLVDIEMTGCGGDPFDVKIINALVRKNALVQEQTDTNTQLQVDQDIQVDNMNKEINRLKDELDEATRTVPEQLFGIHHLSHQTQAAVPKKAVNGTNGTSEAEFEPDQQPESSGFLGIDWAKSFSFGFDSNNGETNNDQQEN